jgi:hypothetical protein
MPQAAAAAVVSWLGATGATAAIVTAVVEVIVTIAISAGLAALAGKPKQSFAGAGSRDVTVKGTVSPRQLLYGEVRTGGYIAFYDSTVYGAENRYLWFVVVVAGHQCQEISDCWLDSQQILSSEIDGSTGEVSTEAFVNDGTSRLAIFKHLGTSNQAVDAALTANSIADWDSTHQGSGIAYVVYRLDRDEKIYPNGAPQSFFQKVKGRRLYDPRLDSTNGGSGSHLVDDATTWEWSPNSALAVRDYIAGGSIYYNVETPDKRLTLGEIDSRIDDSFFSAAANICDESVDIPGSEQQRRYTCDAQLSCDDTHAENMNVLLSSCIGHVSAVGGKYRLYVGAYDVPTVALNEDDIQGPVQVPTHPVGEDVYNLVIGTFFDDARGWLQSPFPARVNLGYESDDGEQKKRSIELFATRSSYRAQRIAEIHLQQSRNKISAVFTQLSPKAMNIAEWETFKVTISEYGWSEKVFRCTKWQFLPSGFIAIESREENSEAYADPDVADYGEPGAAVSPAPQIELPSPVTNFSAQGGRGGIQFTWDLPAVGLMGGIVELWEYPSATPFSSATKIWDGLASGKWITKTDTTQRYYWVRVRSGLLYSSVVPASDGLPAKSAVVDSTLSASALPTSASGTDSDLDGDATTNSVTVTPVGGAPGYTYAWTWTSGGTGIDIDSSSSATTTFSESTSLSAGETRSGIARCTVTDGAAATYTVDVAVQIDRPSASVIASISPTALHGSRLGAGSVSTSAPNSGFSVCTGVPSGGTYSWVRVSGDSSVNPTNSTSQSTRFSATSVGVGSDKNASFACDYTQGGNTTRSNTVSVVLIADA